MTTRPPADMLPSRAMPISALLILLAASLLAGCSAQVVSVPPPPDSCVFGDETTRYALCNPEQPAVFLCTNAKMTNPDPGNCTGPKFNTVLQQSGGTWCCGATAPPTCSSATP